MESTTEQAAGQRLKAFLRENKYQNAWIAERVGVKKQTVSTWIKGHVTPSIPARRLIEEATGIPVSAWD